jgi:hypothetical protein
LLNSIRDGKGGELAFAPHYQHGRGFLLR